ncbi:DMT family transporter [Bordetella sp. BOR01]|uniref:DMT family transporter n=1 Tax=Bordetella sp. BOR01 TaxID=2854779 RepID=UPI001C452961|nr:DMT family transporter [Bordetella sp. BOR01]MBV7483970.1 DMT family transporter [Bordetella sp. BOR01]
MTRRIQGYWYLALAMVTVGSTVVASKLIAAGLPPFTATALRFAVALPLFVALMALTRTPWPRPDRRDGLVLLLQAGAGSVGYTALLISGLRYTSAADAGIIIGTLPVVSTAVAIVVLGERPRPAALGAIGLAAAGVFFIAAQGNPGQPRSLLGNALIFGAIVCEGLFILLNKRLRQPLRPLAQSTWMSALGLAVAAAAAMFETPWSIALAPGALAAVAYYAVIPTVAGFLLWYAGAERVTGTEASLFTAVAPVSALLLAAGVLGEPVTPRQLIGVACVLASVFILSRTRPA